MKYRLFELMGWMAAVMFSPLYSKAAESINILSWPRMSADKFGCYLEKTFGHKDKKFNCSLKNYVNKGDPCKNTEAYYEGPAFPDSLARKLHPEAKSIQLSWEHGELQAITIFFDKDMTDKKIEQDFNLPQSNNYPGNINNISTGNCTEPCLSITGFDHMGAGELECP